jgi:hypothetical protein
MSSPSLAEMDQAATSDLASAQTRRSAPSDQTNVANFRYAADRFNALTHA